MNPGRFTLLATAFAAVVSLSACAVGSDGHSNLAAPAHDAGAIARVLLLSVDGLHEEDVARCIAASTCPHIAALGRIVAELREKHLAATTLIVLTAKHGQSASDHATLVKHGDTLTELLQAHGILDSNGRIGQAATVSHQPNDGTGLVGTGLVQTDDVGLIWLKNQSRTAEVVALLKANAGCTAEGICADGPHARILSGAALAEKFGDPVRGRAPDIIVLPNPGVLYSASKKKDADHGGDAPDDRHVALIVSLPSWAGRINAAPVATTQVAPTILAALKLDPTLLHAVKAERTPALPDITFP